MTKPVHPVPAVGCVCFRGNEVLLVRRGQAPREGEWSIPGGRIEFGETAKTAVMRELTEETGVQADLIALIDVVDAIFEAEPVTDTAIHYVLIDYLARWISGDPIAADDVTDARFVKLSQLEQFGVWDETRRIILKGYSLLQTDQA
ncbi:MAG: NUDIX hydrolase [Pseudomonadota bacterium]